MVSVPVHVKDRMRICVFCISPVNDLISIANHKAITDVADCLPVLYSARGGALPKSLRQGPPGDGESFAPSVGVPALGFQAGHVCGHGSAAGEWLCPDSYPELLEEFNISGECMYNIYIYLFFHI